MRPPSLAPIFALNPLLWNNGQPFVKVEESKPSEENVPSSARGRGYEREPS